MALTWGRVINHEGREGIMPDRSARKSTHTHREREDLLLRIRVQTAVEPLVTKPKKGALVTFNTVVFGALPKATGGSAAKRRIARAEQAKPYPLDLSHEPGHFAPGTTRVKLGPVAVPGVQIDGYWFEVTVGDNTKPARCGYKSATGSDADIARVLGDLPQPKNVDTQTATVIKAQARRLVRRGKAAYAELYEVACGLVNTIAHKKYDHHCKGTIVTKDEVRAAGYPHVANAIALFASAERPDYTFARHVQTSADRDMNRALNVFATEKEDTRMRRHAMDKVRHLSNDPAELAELMNLEAHKNRVRRNNRALSAEQVTAKVEEDRKAGRIKETHTVASVTRLLENPAPRAVSLDAPLSNGTDESTFALADKVAVHHDRDVTDYSFRETLETICFAHEELTPDHFLAFIHKMGLQTETDDITRPAAIPTTGHIGQAAHMLFGPFLLEAESWTKAEHRNNARRRAYERLTDKGRVKDPVEIAQAWQTILHGHKPTGQTRLVI